MRVAGAARHELDDVSEPYSWLTTIAIREAVKLDRAERRRARPFALEEHDVGQEPVAA